MTLEEYIHIYAIKHGMQFRVKRYGKIIGIVRWSEKDQKFKRVIFSNDENEIIELFEKRRKVA